MRESDRKDKQPGTGPTAKRAYAPPRLIEYGSVAKLTQGTRTLQQDAPGATTFKKAGCL